MSLKSFALWGLYWDANPNPLLTINLPILTNHRTMLGVVFLITLWIKFNAYILMFLIEGLDIVVLCSLVIEDSHEIDRRVRRRTKSCKTKLHKKSLENSVKFVWRNNCDFIGRAKIYKTSVQQMRYKCSVSFFYLKAILLFYFTKRHVFKNLFNDVM